MLEHELTDAVRRGDKTAFARLMEYTGKGVVSLIARHVPASAVEEVQQETWIRIWKAMESYRDQGKLLGFCRTIAARSCHDWWRKNGQRETPQAALGQEGAARFELLLQSQDMRAFLHGGDPHEFEGLIDWVFTGLKPEDRMLARLVFLEDWKPAEAAASLGQSAVWARVRLHRMKSRLKDRVEGWLQTQHSIREER